MRPPPAAWQLIAGLSYPIVVGATRACAPATPSPLFYRVRYAHNLFMVAASAMFFAYSLQFVTTGGLAQYVCSDPTLVSPLFDTVQIMWVLSKVWEWIDTCLLVYSRKPVSFLHCFHHITTVYLFSTTVQYPYLSKIGMLLNGGVHIAMYSHYASPLPARMVPFITGAQIVQFVCVFWCLFVAWRDECKPSLFDQGEAHATVVRAGIVATYLVLFCRYFISRFPLRRRPVGDAKNL